MRKYMAHCWRSKDKLISDILLWTPTYVHTSVGWPIRIYIHQLCADTESCLKNLPSAMADRDGCWGRVKGIHAAYLIVVECKISNVEFFFMFMF